MSLSQSERSLRWRTKYSCEHKKNYDDWRAKNKEQRNSYARQWHAKTRAADEEAYKEKTRRYRLKRRYGISPVDYDSLLLKQGGHCALCDRKPDQERYGYLHVDHCHDSNKIRGLLCEQHNLALGKMGDTEVALLRALDYIKGMK